MLCQNCGAEYADGSLRCPYCHSENAGMAEQMKKEILESYDREAEQMKKTVADRAVHRWTFYLVRGLCLLLAVGIVAAIAAVIWGRVSAGLSHSGEKAHVEKLEAFCEKEDYNALCAYLEKETLYGIKYEKYNQIGSVYRSYLFMENEIVQIKEILGNDNFTREKRVEMSEYWMESALHNAAKTLTQCRQNIDDNVFLGNEDILEDIYGECRKSLSALGLSEEEINMLEQGDTDYEDLLRGRLLDMLLTEN